MVSFGSKKYKKNTPELLLQAEVQCVANGFGYNRQARVGRKRQKEFLPFHVKIKPGQVIFHPTKRISPREAARVLFKPQGHGRQLLLFTLIRTRFRGRAGDLDRISNRSTPTRQGLQPFAGSEPGPTRQRNGTNFPVVPLTRGRK